MRSHTRKASELDARGIEIQFSPQMHSAFQDLAAAVHFSEHFDGDMLSVLQDWAAGKRKSVHDILIALPLIAQETFKHIQATGDDRAREAWDEICSQMSEKGFTLTQDRQREK
jgi:hypothetical protein